MMILNGIFAIEMRVCLVMVLGWILNILCMLMISHIGCHYLQLILLRLKMSDWSPIETAPKDGTPILCYDPFKPKDERIYVVIFVKGCDYHIDGCHIVRKCAWQEASGEGYFTWNPTHWMPLPPEVKY